MTEKKKETLHGISEAPASLNFYGVTARGWNVQFTLRDFDENLLLDRFGVFVKALEDQFNVVPKAIGRQPDGNGGDVSQNTPVPPPTSSVQPPVQPQEELFFEAVSMAATTESGKEPRWKVKGGKYMEWGVTIWPEVLEAAGFNPLGLDPSQVYTLEGYTAYCEANEKGNPKKVVNLAK